MSSDAQEAVTSKTTGTNQEKNNRDQPGTALNTRNFQVKGGRLRKPSKDLFCRVPEPGAKESLRKSSPGGRTQSIAGAFSCCEDAGTEDACLECHHLHFSSGGLQGTKEGTVSRGNPKSGSFSPSLRTSCESTEARRGKIPKAFCLVVRRTIV